MSKLYVNEIFPQSGTVVKISGSLEFASGSEFTIFGSEGNAAKLILKADEGDNHNDVLTLSITDGGATTMTGSSGFTFDTSNITVSGNLSAIGTGNPQTITTVTYPDNHNSILWGPITIDDDEDMTIGDNSNVKIIDITDQ